MGTTTTTFTLNKPTVGGDDNAWGTDWNTNADKIDDLLDGTTAIKPNLSEGLWKVGGTAITATAAEINYIDGVTSAIQTQLDAKQALDADLTAIAGLSSSGMIARTGAGTAAARTVTAGTGIAVTNGDGVSGNPTVAADLASQAEAEAGTDNTKVMTPLRVAQAIDALANPADYESAQQVITTASSFTLSHGLGKLPSNVQAWFVCVTASEGFAVDDWYGPLGAETFADGANNGIAIAMNTSQVKVKLGSFATPILNFSTGGRGITYTNWRLVVRAWK
jgi:hypothetical protein